MIYNLKWIQKNYKIFQPLLTYQRFDKEGCNLPKFARVQNYYFNYPSLTPSPSLL